MEAQSYELFAIKYARLSRRAADNFVGGDPHDVDMPLNYFVWVARGPTKTYVIDTGFGPEVGARRGRQILHPVAEGLHALGVDPATVEDVIVTHMHYDHAGNLGLFPRARYHLQEKEMQFATGRCMCHGYFRHGYEAADVTGMVERVFDDRVQFCDGSTELAPGIELHLTGGHTGGMQVVRVRTRRGWVVLASDASHFYAHMEQDRVFTIVHDVERLLQGYRTLRRLATSPAHIVPGHDPLVMERYPAAFEATADWIVRLDAEPLS